MSAVPNGVAGVECFGLPFVGRSPIESYEIAAIHRRRRVLVGGVVWAFTLMLVGPFVCVLVRLLLPERWAVAVAWNGAIALIAFLVGVAAGIAFLFQLALEGLRLRSDLRAGEVLVFRGDFPEPEPDDSYANAYPAPGLAELRVLPRTKKWLRFRGHRLVLQAVVISPVAPSSGDRG